MRRLPTFAVPTSTRPPSATASTSSVRVDRVHRRGPGTVRYRGRAALVGHGRGHDRGRAWPGERFDALRVSAVCTSSAMGLLAVSLLLLAWAPALWVTLAASLGVGLGAGTMFGHVNQHARGRRGRDGACAADAGGLHRQGLAADGAGGHRLGVAVGLDWQFVVVPVLVLVAVLFLWTRSAGRSATGHAELGRLPWAYWLPWTADGVGHRPGVLHGRLGRHAGGGAGRASRWRMRR